MNIIFAGSPKFSAEILSQLDKSSFNVSLVLTQPDKRSARNKPAEPTEVAKFAESSNLPCLKVESFSDETIKVICEYPCDFLVLSSFGTIIPKEILDHAKISPLNVHFSKLPLYRGASPIQSALLNGDKKTAISFMEMTESLDDGPVFDVIEVDISSKDNRLTLEDKLVSKAKENIVDVINKISNGLVPVTQKEKDASYCNKISKADGKINFNKTTDEILNKHRAFFGWPGTFFVHNEIPIKVHEMGLFLSESTAMPGSIIDINKDGIYIKTSDSAIVITHIQLPGKKIINSIDIYNSYKDFFV